MIVLDDSSRNPGLKIESSILYRDRPEALDWLGHTGEGPNQLHRVQGLHSPLLQKISRPRIPKARNRIIENFRSSFTSAFIALPFIKYRDVHQSNSNSFFQSLSLVKRFLFLFVKNKIFHDKVVHLRSHKTDIGILG